MTDSPRNTGEELVEPMLTGEELDRLEEIERNIRTTVSQAAILRLIRQARRALPRAPREEDAALADAGHRVADRVVSAWAAGSRALDNEDGKTVSRLSARVAELSGSCSSPASGVGEGVPSAALKAALLVLAHIPRENLNANFQRDIDFALEAVRLVLSPVPTPQPAEGGDA